MTGHVYAKDYILLNRRSNKKIHPLEVNVRNISYIPLDNPYLLAGCPDCDLVENFEFEAATVPWHLDRIDQAIGLDNSFQHVYSSQGELADIYVLDSGVRASHVSFKNRVKPGFDATDMFFDQAMDDCNSHGTHVASIAASDPWGIARRARIIPVRILDCGGRGQFLWIARAAEYVLANMNPQRRNIINLSIQSEPMDVLDEIVRILHHAGALVVVAAANYNYDACFYSPAREPLALTVGATTKIDTKLSISNYGPCVDLYAPGENIEAASAHSDTGTLIKRGTSMATPLVAGIAAVIWTHRRELDNVEVKRVLLSMAVELLDMAPCPYAIPRAPLAQINTYAYPRTSFSYTTSQSEFEHWPFTSIRAGQHVVLDINWVSGMPGVRIAVAEKPIPNLLTSCVPEWYLVFDSSKGTLQKSGITVATFKQDVVAKAYPHKSMTISFIHDEIRFGDYATVAAPRNIEWFSISFATTNSHTARFSAKVVDTKAPSPAPTTSPTALAHRPLILDFTINNKGHFDYWFTNIVAFVVKRKPRKHNKFILAVQEPSGGPSIALEIVQNTFKFKKGFKPRQAKLKGKQWTLRARVHPESGNILVHRQTNKGQWRLIARKNVRANPNTRFAMTLTYKGSIPILF